MNKLILTSILLLSSLLTLSQTKCYAIDIDCKDTKRTIYEGCLVNLKFKDGLKTSQGLVLKITADSITLTKKTTWVNSTKIYSDTTTKAIKDIVRFSSPSLVVRRNSCFRSRPETNECYKDNKNCTY